MKREDYEKRLEELYKLALEQGKIGLALEILKIIAAS